MSNGFNRGDIRAFFQGRQQPDTENRRENKILNEVEYHGPDDSSVSEQVLNDLTDALVIGIKRTHSLDLSDKLMLKFDDMVRGAFASSPHCANTLAKIIDEVNRESHEGEFLSRQNVPALSLDELADLAAQRLGQFGFGELSEQDFEAVKEELRDDGFPEDMIARLDHSDALRRIGEIEDSGMPRDRP